MQIMFSEKLVASKDVHAHLCLMFSKLSLIQVSPLSISFSPDEMSDEVTFWKRELLQHFSSIRLNCKYFSEVEIKDVYVHYQQASNFDTIRATSSHEFEKFARTPARNSANIAIDGIHWRWRQSWMKRRATTTSTLMTATTATMLAHLSHLDVTRTD